METLAMEIVVVHYSPDMTTRTPPPVRGFSEVWFHLEQRSVVSDILEFTSTLTLIWIGY